MSYWSVWVAAMAFLFSQGCTRGPEKRLLAVGGTHVFERQTPCRLVRAEPEDAVTDLEWTDSLALEAGREGTAEVVCGDERLLLEFAAPARLDVEVVDGTEQTALVLRERVKVQARLYDRQGRALEVGKLTLFEWTASAFLEAANDRSAGEFGLCDTCYGMHNFRAVQPGKGSIEARLGRLWGVLMVEAGP